MAEINTVVVPDIGNYKDVPIIEVAVSVGDVVKAEQSLLTLETDKATMDVPAPFDGVVKEVKVKVGDKVSEGTVIVLIESSATTAAPVASNAQTAAPTPTPVATPAPAPTISAPVTSAAPAAVVQAAGGSAHASPAIRRFARELGVDLSQVKGSGAKGRVTKIDVENFVKQSLAQPRSAAAGGSLPGLLPWPEVDFAKFGAIESKPLSRIKKISGANLHRNWVMIPHVTQFEEADISEMEVFRKQLGAEYAKDNIKITPLAFMLKAVATTLRHFPDFCASLDAAGENLIVKKYIHIGVAVDTPDGLMVPVIRDADQKGIVQLAKELGEISAKARDKN